MNLVNDLRKNQQALDVFLLYYQMYQVIDNSPLLEAMVANDGFNENNIL